MISGATRGTGGRRLGAHVADAKELNEETRLGASRGLIGDTIREQVAELTAMASHSRAKQPIYHVHADPPADGAEWGEREWDCYWSLFEQEFGLERAAFGEQTHAKDGREHRHREYMLVRSDGTTNPMRNDYARREKLSRILEFETGAPFVKGTFNKKVVEFLRRDGREDVAAAMERAGLLEGPKPRAAMTPRERAQAERTGVDPRDVGAKALAAWIVSDDGRSFRQALLASGLRLAQGDRAPVIVDAAGGTHPLARLLGKESGAAGLERIPAAAVSARLADLELARLPEGGRGRKRDLEVLANSDPAEIPVPQDAAPEGAAGPAEEEAVVDPVPPTPTPEAPPAELVPAGETESAAAAPAAPPAPAGGDAAPAAPLSSSGGGGGGGDEAPVDALDARRPDDLARFFSQTAAAEKRKEKRLAALDDRVSRDAQAKAAEAAKKFGDRIYELFATAAEERARTERITANGRPEQENTQHEPAGRDSRGHRGAGGGSQDPQFGRQERHDPGELRGADGRAEQRAVAGIAGPPGSAAEGGADPDGPGPRDAGADRVEPGARGAGPGGKQSFLEGHSLGATRVVERGGPGQSRDPEPASMQPSHVVPPRADLDAARIQLQERRDSKHLAATAGRWSETLRDLIARLDGTPDRIAAAEARQESADRRKDIDRALSRDGERIERVLSRAPYPDPASRDLNALMAQERMRVTRGVEEARAKAKQARHVATAAQERTGVLGRMGLPTAGRRSAEAAEKVAQVAEDGAQQAERWVYDALKDAERRAEDRAYTRQRDQDQWECRRNVQQARREEHGNELVRRAVEDGDPEIEQMAAKDLDGAREEMLRREAEQRLREEQARLERERERAKELEHQAEAEPELEHAHGGGPRGGAPAPAPRKR